MAKNATVTVYPVPGLWLDGVPAVPTTTDAETAAALCASGAFTLTAPAEAPDEPAGDPAPTQEETE